MSLEALGVALCRAANPGPLTLSGTNTWIVGRDPAWIVDPGPLLDEHLDAVAAEAEARGGAGGIALTHDHVDHSEGASALRDRSLALYGRYVFGDVCKDRVYSARLGPSRSRDGGATSLQVPAIVSFGEDARGRVHVVSLDGPVYRLAPR